MREAQVAEWEDVCDLRLHALAETPEAFGQTLEQAQQMSAEEWRKWLEPRADRVWFVEETSDRRLVGMAVGFFDATEKVAAIGGMYVDPEERRTGIGRRLVYAVEAWARERGAERIELEVNPETIPALRLYQSCGYQPTGKSRPLPGHPSATAIEMTKLTLPRP
jgi:GNAT superfamily N-acetyltransferase